MEVDSHVLSAGEKADGRRAVTGTDQRCPRFGSTVKRRPGRRVVVRRRPGHRAALAPVRRLLARTVTGTLKCLAALAALVISFFSGGTKVDSRVTSAARSRTGDRPAREKACTSDNNNYVYNHGCSDKTTEAKTLACNAVPVAAGPFWLGCPGPPNSTM